MIELKIEAGSDGQESENFAAMLRLMYRLWAHRHKITVFSESLSDDLKVISMKFDTSIKRMSQEHGIHRLIRIPSFDEQRRRHTSFAQVRVEGIKNEIVTWSIRSYVLDPYKMAKDHRTGKETSKVENVLDGGTELDTLMRR